MRIPTLFLALNPSTILLSVHCFNPEVVLSRPPFFLADILCLDGDDQEELGQNLGLYASKVGK
jgi:hypothetical protein